MRILYDHQIFGRQVYGGISRYFYKLIQHLMHADQVDMRIAIKYAKFAEINKLQTLCPYLKANKGWDTIFQKPNSVNRKLSLRVLASGEYDLFHPTYYSPYFLPALQDKPYILTVHDLIHEVFQQEGNIESDVLEEKRLLLDNAAHIIAVSENTRRDIQRFYAIAPEKISVVYHAADFGITTPSPLSQPVPERYLLFVGSRRKYKNFKLFIKAVAPILQKTKGLAVLCIGGHSLSKEELSLCKSLSIAPQVQRLKPTDQEMVWLYQHAEALVYPSLYEGFGLPVLEAFACNCPAIISQTSSLPEVGGDAAAYFDPTSEESIRQTVSNVLESPEKRETMIAQGQVRQQEFSWEKAAEQTEQIYRNVLLNTL